MTANTFAVKQLPLLSAGSDLDIMFRKRKKHWMDSLPVVDWTEPYALHQLSASIRYNDERHYEVFKMGGVFREDQAEAGLSDRGLWNAHYDFDFEVYMTASQVADRSYFIRLHLSPHFQVVTPPPPEAGKYLLPMLPVRLVIDHSGNPGTQVEIEEKIPLLHDLTRYS